MKLTASRGLCSLGLHQGQRWLRRRPAPAAGCLRLPCRLYSTRVLSGCFDKSVRSTPCMAPVKLQCCSNAVLDGDQ